MSLRTKNTVVTIPAAISREKGSTLRRATPMPQLRMIAKTASTIFAILRNILACV